MKPKTVDEIQSKIEEMQTVKNQMEDIMKTKSKLESIQELKQGIALIDSFIDGLRYCICSEERGKGERGDDSNGRQ
jgi:hypothetical protein